jgi:hypothetical protein
VRRVPKDYGVDLEVELVDQEFVSGNRIWCQVKATTNLRRTPLRVSGGRRLLVPTLAVDTRLLLYSLRCPFPLLLFVCDLGNADVFWIPLRDHVDACLQKKKPRWRECHSVSVRLPPWNNLRKENENGFYGLRWYALEPARMIAFARLHAIHHELQYQARLDGYEIGDGCVDSECELSRSVDYAHDALIRAVAIDVLFGTNGIDAYRVDGGEHTIGARLKVAIQSLAEVRAKLPSGSYSFHTLSHLLGRGCIGVSLLSTAIAHYDRFRERFVLSDGALQFNAEARRIADIESDTS